MTEKSAAADNSATIGSLNGWWRFALKVQLTLFPVLVGCGIAWASWVTRAIFRLAPDVPRYSYADAAREHAQLWERVDARLDALPPADWRMRILKMEGQLQGMRDNQTKMLIELERLDLN